LAKYEYEYKYLHRKGKQEHKRQLPFNSDSITLYGDASKRFKSRPVSVVASTQCLIVLLAEEVTV